MPKLSLLSRCVLGAAAVAATLAAAGIALAAPASAAGPGLVLSEGSYGRWVATGSGYASGRTDVSDWVMDVTGGGWTLLEHHTGKTTTSPWCSAVTCFLGGTYSDLGSISLAMGPFGLYWVATHPLACGHSYQPITYDAADGYVYGTVLTEPACVPLH